MRENNDIRFRRSNSNVSTCSACLGDDKDAPIVKKDAEAITESLKAMEEFMKAMKSQTGKRKILQSQNSFDSAKTA